MSRNGYFFQVRISHVLRFISICDLFTDSPSYVTMWWRILKDVSNTVYICAELAATIASPSPQFWHFSANKNCRWHEVNYPCRAKAMSLQRWRLFRCRSVYQLPETLTLYQIADAGPRLRKFSRILLSDTVQWPVNLAECFMKCHLKVNVRC
jgi:hypothetical protein